MKKKIRLILFVVIGLAILGYLIGSFSQASFNLSQWDQKTRDAAASSYAIVIMSAIFLISEKQ